MSNKTTFRYWLLCLLFPLQLFASHIVGGDIQFYPTNSTTNTYYIGLHLYFDVANGRTQAEDQSVRLYIYQKSDNAPKGNILLPQTTRKLINYSNANCPLVMDLETRIIIYSGSITLNAAEFQHPDGYYIVWERCCRNGIINNIVNPSRVGATFYLEFPPLNIPNSSPRFGELTGDYICLNRPFNFDFSAKDPDGDSLVYSIVQPWAGYSSSGSAMPTPRGASNYPEVTWVPGIDLKNVIPGPKPLRINPTTGNLTVTAGQNGLYVFAVMVEEYRKGVKIGFVRREFQLKVVDCPYNAPPAVAFREVGKKVFYKEGETIYIKKDQAKCFDFLITDPDPGQRVFIRSKSLNFDDKGLTIEPAFITTRTSKDTLTARICMDKCVESRNGQPMIFEVIVSDDGCPQGIIDTLKVRMVIEPAFNNKPKTTTDWGSNQVNVQQLAVVKFNVKSNDLDNDDLILEARPRGFQLAQAGMTFMNTTGKGALSQPFSWTTTCTTPSQEYVIDFITTDISCNRQSRDTVTVRLKANAKVNSVPTITTSLGGANAINVTQPTGANKGVSFDVIADDADRDPITLTAVGKGFDLKKYKMNFTDKQGVPRLTSKFDWTPDCALFKDFGGKTLTVDFMTEDNSCGPLKSSTFSMQFNIQSLPPLGIIPENLPNVITPNNDGKNDCFMVENLPSLLCGSRFERIAIVNRWGKNVYDSADVNFRWCADGISAGQYFYTLYFSDRSFKGIMSVIR
jgi:gliding motility-associated-like protein